MTSTIRRHTRWWLLVTAALLCMAFTLHEVGAQFRPPRPPRPTFPSRPPSRPPRIPSLPIRPPSMPSPGIPGMGQARYYCGKCNREVSRFSTTCPFCGVRFNGTVVDAGSGRGTPGRTPPPPRPTLPTNPPFAGPALPATPPMTPAAPAATQPAVGGNQPPLQPIATQPPVVPPTDPAVPPLTGTTTATTSSSTDSDSSGKKSGLSTKTILGVGLAVLGAFALIAGVVVIRSGSGGASKPTRKRSRRPRDYDD
jgi:hypothetical protein